MIFCYNFNENDTTNFRDYSTNARHGTWNTAPSIVSGDDGLAAEFNSDTNEYGQAGQGYFDGLSAFSVYCKFYIPSSATGTANIMDSNPQCRLYLDYSVPAINCQVVNGNGDDVTVDIEIPSTDAWHEIIAYWDGTNLRIDLNDTSTSNSKNLGGTAANGDQELTLGASDDGTIAGYLDGKIEDIRAYDKALSTNERTALFDFDTGLDVKSNNFHDFVEGDILTSQYDWKGLSAVVTLKVDDSSYKILPIEGPVIGGENWVRQGHCWDSSRQSTITLREVSGECEIEFFDGIQAPGDLSDDSNRVHYLKRDSAQVSYLKRQKWVSFVSPDAKTLGEYSVDILGNAQAKNTGNITFMMPRELTVLDDVHVLMVVLGTGDTTLSIDFATDNADPFANEDYNANQDSRTDNITFTANKIKAQRITALCEGTGGEIHGLSITNSSDTDVYVLGVLITYKT